MFDEIRALITARGADRSSCQAVTHVSDPNSGVTHYHNPPRASGSGVSTVPKVAFWPGHGRRLHAKRTPR
eukprot:1794975-Pleurochrysis_carterae.AAC.1